MHLAASSALFLTFASLFSPCFQARRVRSRSLSPAKRAGGYQEKTSFTGYTCSVDGTWKNADSTCVISNSVHLVAYDHEYDSGPDGKPDTTPSEGVDFTATILSQCNKDSVVFTYIDLSSGGDEGTDPNTSVNIDSQLNSVTIKSTGTAQVYQEYRKLAYDGTSYYRDGCDCTKLSQTTETDTLEAILSSVGSSTPTKFTQSFRTQDFGVDYFFIGTARQATVSSLTLKRADGTVLTVPVSDTNSHQGSAVIGNAKSGQTTYYNY